MKSPARWSRSQMEYIQGKFRGAWGDATPRVSRPHTRASHTRICAHARARLRTHTQIKAGSSHNHCTHNCNHGPALHL